MVCEKSICYIVYIKSNIGFMALAQGFRLTEENSFEWLGACDATEDDFAENKRGGNGGRNDGARKLNEAVELWLDLLADGNTVTSAYAYALMEVAGISKITFERAKAVAGVEKTRIGNLVFYRLGER